MLRDYHYDSICADGPEDDGPDTRGLEECYCGPHSSTTNSTARRFGCIERMGQAEHDVYFGSDDSEYR